MSIDLLHAADTVRATIPAERAALELEQLHARWTPLITAEDAYVLYRDVTRWRATHEHTFIEPRAAELQDAIAAWAIDDEPATERTT